jgi:hypothetical protein
MNLTINTEIPTIRANEVADQARITFATSGTMLFLVGDGGAAKTSISCKTVPEELGIPLWGKKAINFAGMAGTEVTGYGNPQADNTMSFYAPDVWPTIERVGNDPYIVVLDELPDYSTEVRALLRGLTPSSGAITVGPHVLGPNVKFIVTGNLRSSGTRAAIEDAPFTSRCAKFLLVPDVASWCDWFNTQPAARNGSHVPAFLKFGTCGDGSADHFAPAVPMPYDGAPHPTPRGWEAVAEVESFRLAERATYEKFVMGRVGKRAATAYFAFLHHVDNLPDLAALKSDPNYVVSTDTQKQYALTSAALSVTLSGIKDPATAVHAGSFDWIVRLLLQVRGDIREFGFNAAIARGVPLDQHRDAVKLRGDSVLVG